MYALATLGYECLTGVPPFDGESAIQILLQQQSAAVPALLSRRPGLAVPSTLVSLIERNLAKDPESRDADAGVFGRHLRATGQLSSAAVAPALASQTRRGHGVAMTETASTDRGQHAPSRRALGTRRAIVVLFCFLLGAGAALGIATHFGALTERPAPSPTKAKAIAP